MNKSIRACILLLAVAMTVPGELQAVNYYWDTSTEAGVQNGDGIWGTDSFWTTTGTTLTAWGGSKTDNAYFGGNGTLTASPAGNFTITVSGTQQVNQIIQDVASTNDFNFIFTGGQLNANVINIAASTANINSMTVNSVLVDNGGSTMTFSMRNQYKTIALGGDNTFAQFVHFKVCMPEDNLLE